MVFNVFPTANGILCCPENPDWPSRSVEIELPTTPRKYMHAVAATLATYPFVWGDSLRVYSAPEPTASYASFVILPTGFQPAEAQSN